MVLAGVIASAEAIVSSDGIASAGVIVASLTSDRSHQTGKPVHISRFRLVRQAARDPEFRAGVMSSPAVSGFDTACKASRPIGCVSTPPLARRV